MLRRKNSRTTWAGVMGIGLLAVLLVSIPGFGRGFDRTNPKVNEKTLSEQVRHNLVMLPYYGVFDDLQYQIKDNGVVVLSGEVTRPYLRSDAVSAVSRLVGRENVEDRIRVLPLSSFDDRLRIALYRRVFGNFQLDRYTLPAVPSIHIIVSNGHVTLTGVVANQADKNVAGLMANSVPGVFGVVNNLQVEKKG